MVTKYGQSRRVRIGRSERKAEEAAKQGQGFLWPEMDPTFGVEDQEFVHQNLRQAIEAKTTQFRIPSQLVWPNTLRTIAISPTPGGRKSSGYRHESVEFYDSALPQSRGLAMAVGRV